MMKLGTTRCGKSAAEVCQIVDWEGSEIIFDIKREIYPQVAGLPGNPWPRPQH